MGTPQMRAKISIPSIPVNGVIVPVLKAPFTLWRLSAVFGVSRRLTESP